MKCSSVLAVALIICLLSACQAQNPACPTAAGTPRPTLELSQLISMTAAPDTIPTPATIRIGGKMMLVDKVVQGPLCNDTWKGTVYVGCDVQVAGWDENPLFLQGCNLVIAPGTVVYVGAHHDTAYYNGCSCHTEEQSGD